MIRYINENRRALGITCLLGQRYVKLLNSSFYWHLLQEEKMFLLKVQLKK